MLSTLARTAIVATIEKGTGVPPAGPVSTVLLTTGASLLMLKGRRAVGLGLLIAGGAVRWHETVGSTLKPARRAKAPAPAGEDASEATGSR